VTRTTCGAFTSGSILLADSERKHCFVTREELLNKAVEGNDDSNVERLCLNKLMRLLEAQTLTGALVAKDI
jgi:hypothetical protein